MSFEAISFVPEYIAVVIMLLIAIMINIIGTFLEGVYDNGYGENLYEWEEPGVTFAKGVSIRLQRCLREDAR